MIFFGYNKIYLPFVLKSFIGVSMIFFVGVSINIATLGDSLLITKSSIIYTRSQISQTNIYQIIVNVTKSQF